LSLIEQVEIDGSLFLSSDLETRGGHIACIGLAWSELQAICIPFMCVEKKEGYWLEHEEIEIIRLLRKLLTHPGVKVIGQNYLYDAQYIALWWQVLSTCWRDTMYTHWVCWPGTPKGLAYLSSMYCLYHRYWKDEGKDWNAKMPEEILWNYNCIDAVTTFECNKVLISTAKQLGLEEQVQDQMDDFPMLLDMMLRGVKQDLIARAQVLEELMAVIEQKETEIAPMIPEDVWPRIPKAAPWYRSDTQQRQIFYDVLGQKVRRSRQKRRPSVNAECLAQIGQAEPLLRHITVRLEELRSLDKFREVCVWKLDPDQRARCSYDPSGTKTFRYNSKKSAFGTSGNMQNISKGHEDFHD
jgi:DNA polymerase I-like protein with 3'-5' exonuclease and polymerase domains